MEPKNTTLTASGIVCQGCATAAKAAVGKLPGVRNAEVDVAAKTVTVTHDEWTDRAALAEALTEAGFPAE